LPAPRKPMVNLEAMRGFYQEVSALSLPNFPGYFAIPYVKVKLYGLTLNELHNLIGAKTRIHERSV
jgi:hypothetical protein